MINKLPIIAAWRAIISRHPTTFIWADNTYTGFLSPIDSTLDLGLGGFTQGQGTQLFCLWDDFVIASGGVGAPILGGFYLGQYGYADAGSTGGVAPAEEATLTIAGTDYRIREVKKVFIVASDVWGLVFTLKGPSEP